MKGLLVLILFVFTFGAGYYLGGAGTKDIKKSYASLSQEMLTKTRSLESEVSATRVRLNLIEARDFLGSAREAVKEKNFGEAGTDLQKAQDRLAKAISLAGDPQKKSLAPIQSEIDSVKGDIQNLNSKAVHKIEAIEKELDKITS